MVRFSSILSPRSWCLSVPEALKTNSISGESDQKAPMRAIPAEVIAVETQGGQFRVAVRIKERKYRGSFNTLVFGKHKPFIGSCHDGCLILFSTKIPILKLERPSRCGRFTETPGIVSETRRRPHFFR